MRRILAIVFSVMLAGTPFLSGAAGPCVSETRACCHGGATMDCCAAKPSTPSAPVVPAQNPPLNPAVLFTASFLQWTAPEIAVASRISTSSPIDSSSLYARHCALLL